MNKTFILVVLALFAVASFAQGLRPNPVPTKVSSPRVPRFDDLQDNEMALDLSPYPAGMNIQKALTDTLRVMNNDYRVKVGRWDDSQDNEMFLGNGNSRYTVGTVFNPPPRVKPSHLGFDDFEDDFLLSQEEKDRLSGAALRMGMGSMSRGDGGAIPSGSFSSLNPSFLGSGNSGVFVSGGSAPQGGIGATGSGQLSGSIGSTGAHYMIGGTVSHNPGSPVTILPHVGLRRRF